MDECEWHWHCPMCPRVYVISGHLLLVRGEDFCRRALDFHRDQHINEHCEDFAEEMELADL